MQSRNYSSPFWLIGLVALLICSSGVTLAQTNSQSAPSNPVRLPPRTTAPMSSAKSSPSDDDDGPPLTTFEEEMRAKRLIRSAEKEHKQNIERAQEISQLAKDLQQAFKTSNTLDREGVKRLERLEKLTKKIRGEAGGESGEVQIPNRPTDKAAALTQMADAAESLSKSVQNTPRQVVSAAVIDGANVLLELIAIFRTFTQ
jgi:paraquat-inducible protein B